MNSRTLIYSLFIGLALLSLGAIVILPSNTVNMASAQNLPLSAESNIGIDVLNVATLNLELGIGE